MNKRIWLTSDFAVVECCVCGIIFGVPSEWDYKLRRNHNSFWCPKGHSQSYVSKSDEQKLRDRLRLVMDDRDVCIENMETQVATLKTKARSEYNRANYLRRKLTRVADPPTGEE